MGESRTSPPPSLVSQATRACTMACTDVPGYAEQHGGRMEVLVGCCQGPSASPRVWAEIGSTVAYAYQPCFDLTFVFSGCSQVYLRRVVWAGMGEWVGWLVFYGVAIGRDEATLPVAAIWFFMPAGARSTSSNFCRCCIASELKCF